MSLADNALSTGEAPRPLEQTKQEQQNSSYRDAARPLCHEGLDDTLFADLYNMIGQAAAGATKADAATSVSTQEDEKKDEDKGLAPPALPARSALRASRLLDSFGLKLGSPQPAGLTQAVPHEMYLSSEEDASSTADDVSDYDYDCDFESDADEEEEQEQVEIVTAVSVAASPEQRPQTSPVRRRRSHEDTARVVSVVFVGRPSIVMVESPVRRSISPNSLEERTRQASTSRSSASSSAEQSRSASPASSTRRRSTSSVSTGDFRPPPRSSSKMVSGLLGARARPPPFLQIDPFASKPSTPKENREEDNQPKTPKTPTAMFKRTMSLVRKRSRPALNTLAAAQQSQGSLPMASASVQNLSIGPANEVLETPPASAPLAGPSHEPVRYQDIIKSARRNASHASSTPTPTTAAPTTPMSPIPQSPPATTTTTTRRVFSFAMSRRRSIKAG